MRTAAETIAHFKGITDENKLIAELLRTKFGQFVVDPVLDVGAGTGDIAKQAWPDRKVTLLDIADYDAYAVSPKHARIRADFFDQEWSNGYAFQTMLMCHVLQYLDDDLSRLHSRIEALRPKYVVTVTNDNSEPTMQRILEFGRGKIGDINAEADKYEFVGYNLTKVVRFKSTIKGRTFEELAAGFFAVIFDRLLDPDELKFAVQNFRALGIEEPTVSLDQIIRGYRRAKTK